MRIIEKILIIIDSDDPSGDLDSIIEDGAVANGYTATEYTISETVGDKYWKLVKEE